MALNPLSLARGSVTSQVLLGVRHLTRVSLKPHWFYVRDRHCQLTGEGPEPGRALWPGRGQGTAPGHGSSHGSAECHCSEPDRAGRPRLWTAARVAPLGSLCSYGWAASTFLSPFLCPQARDVYEEAIRTVMTVRDFTQVFDSYAQFEESMIAAKMETASELGREEEGELPRRSWAGEGRRPGWRAGLRAS